MRKKIILGIAAAVVLTFALSMSVVIFAKSKVNECSDHRLSFTGITFLKGLKPALCFKEEKELLGAEFFYSMPSGIIYKRVSLTEILIRVDKNDNLKITDK